MDVPAIHQRHVDGCGTIHICDHDSGGDRADTEHGHRDPTMKRTIGVVIIIIALIVIGNLGGLWWVSNW